MTSRAVSRWAAATLPHCLVAEGVPCQESARLPYGQLLWTRLSESAAAGRPASLPAGPS
jgi:hypothetical protein